jgi:predicted permease
MMLWPDFSLILCGYLLCRFTPLNRSVWQPVENLVYFCLFPVMLFQAILRSPLDFHTDGRLIAAGLLMGGMAILGTYALPHLPLLKRFIPGADFAASAQVAFRFNSFIALAVSERLAGHQGAVLVAVLIGCLVPLMNIAAVWPMARHGEHHFLRALGRNPLVITTSLALTLNLLGWQVPDLFEVPLTRMSQAALALGLMAAGAGLDFHALKGNKVLSAGVLSVRHVLTPALAWCLVQGLALDATQAMVLMAFSAMPTASSCYVLASRMGFNGPYVAGLVTLSTVLGMASIPLTLSVFELSRPF